MRRDKPDVEPDRRYSIKEICNLLYICRDTINKYTQMGIIERIEVSSREIYYLGSEILKLHSELTKAHDL